MKKNVAVLFDLDGTILDTLTDLADSVNLVLEYYNYPLRTYEEVRNFVGNGNLMLIRRALPNGLVEDEISLIYEKFVEVYNKNMMNKTKPYPGIIDLMKALKEKGIVMGIVSNKYQAGVDILHETFFKDYIDVAIGTRKGIPHKPSPDLCRLAMKELDLSLDTNDIYYIGDSEVDIKTARASKLKMISVTWGFRTINVLKEFKPDFIIDEVEDILKIIDQ